MIQGSSATPARPKPKQIICLSFIIALHKYICNVCIYGVELLPVVRLQHETLKLHQKKPRE
nr:MAG TPA: hypothetical protein [Caudoviricetes sp.]